ncbi:alpha/beta hydrolase [Boudabousia liubingyangii]|uniref:Alpha/beta hydrolase n=1 Tax=Boudabousia liubingyangii TaxID=1921764 RepID=A0A1Q5PK85_9ACTO|nr:alpha/beta hydrolase [Boudabousia liubingyangii]OKL46639.1 alpha/beta hydrolase [Boudabousia liubingyangii]
MTEVEITTPRGVALSGTLTEPVDAKGSVVVFAHSFLGDRHSSGRFDRLAGAYRAAGYATMRFDFSGCGLSGDDAITTAHQVEDLRSVCAWLADRGYANQIIHAHSFGAVTALKARPSQAKTMILTSPVTGPMLFDWSQIFSPEQLDELEAHGATRIPDDGPGPREWFVITRETLLDLSLNKSDELLTDLPYPLLIVFDADDLEVDIVEQAQENFTILPAGSRIHIAHEAQFSDPEQTEALVDISVRWATARVNPRMASRVAKPESSVA